LSGLAAANPNVIALSADLGRSSGLDRFSREYPDQFMNTGISEQNMVGVSAGLSRMGFDVFASTFAPFASMRASEQVRMNMGYMHEPVKLVALGSGLAMGFLGNSHYGLEDLAVMRAIPGLTVISPADCVEVFKTLEACIGFEHPVYIRLTGAVSCPVVYTEDYEFQIGRAVWIRQPQKVTIISAGTTVGHCMKAADALAEDGIEVGLLNMHTVKPLD
jgi:transketolase